MSSSLPIVPAPDTIDQEPLPIQDVNSSNGGGGNDEEAAAGGGGGAFEDVPVDGVTGPIVEPTELGNNNNKKNKRRVWLWTAIVVVVVLLCIVIGAVVGTKNKGASAASAAGAKNLEGDANLEGNANDDDTTSSKGDSEQATGPDVSVCSTTTPNTCPAAPAAAGTGAGGDSKDALSVRARAVGTPLLGQATGDLFGTALSVNCDGTVLAVGSSENSDRSGYVKVYRWQTVSRDDESEGLGPSWSWRGKLGITVSGNSSSSNSSSSGEGGGGGGAAGEWVQYGPTIRGGDRDSPDQFGYAVSLSSDGLRLAIASPFADALLPDGTVMENAGSVQVFEYDGDDGDGDDGEVTDDAATGDVKNDDDDDGNSKSNNKEGSWRRIGQVLWGEAANDGSGRSVQLNGDGTVLVVGASGNDGAGHAKVYRLETAELAADTGMAGSETKTLFWKQFGNGIDGEGPGDWSANAVAVSSFGRVVAVSAFRNDAAFPRRYTIVNGTNATDAVAEDAGHVRVFSYSEEATDWIQMGNDIDGNTVGGWHEMSLALSGDGRRLVVGEPGSDAMLPGSNALMYPGVTRVYDLVVRDDDDEDGGGGAEWSQVGDDLRGGGYSVDITQNGNRVVLGSHRGIANGPNSGQVLAYEYTPPDGTATAASSAYWTPIILGDENDDDDDENGKNETGTDKENNILGGILGGGIVGQHGSMFGTSVALSSDGVRVLVSAPVTAGIGSVTAYDLCPLAG